VAGSCCRAAYGDFFDESTARRDARTYRRKGLTGTARRMAEWLGSSGVEGASVLEVGGGVGALQLELLRAGVSRAANVELSPAYEGEARALARDAGLEDRVSRVIADFVDDDDASGPADVVVMNKVVCCYPDYEALVGRAAELATRSLLMSFPRQTWYVRAGFRVMNTVLRLRGSAFRAYVHPSRAVVEAATRRGLVKTLDERGALWQLVALERTA